MAPKTSDSDVHSIVSRASMTGPISPQSNEDGNDDGPLSPRNDDCNDMEIDVGPTNTEQEGEDGNMADGFGCAMFSPKCRSGDGGIPEKDAPVAEEADEPMSPSKSLCSCQGRGETIVSSPPTSPTTAASNEEQEAMVSAPNKAESWVEPLSPTSVMTAGAKTGVASVGSGESKVAASIKSLIDDSDRSDDDAEEDKQEESSEEEAVKGEATGEKKASKGSKKKKKKKDAKKKKKKKTVAFVEKNPTPLSPLSIVDDDFMVTGGPMSNRSQRSEPMISPREDDEETLTLDDNEQDWRDDDDTEQDWCDTYDEDDMNNNKVSLLSKAKNRSKKDIHRRTPTSRQAMDDATEGPPTEVDIPDDDSEASIMVLMRYMGCTPVAYGKDPKHPVQWMDNELGPSPSGKEFVFDSYDDDNSLLSDEETFVTNASSLRDMIAPSWTLKNEEEGVEMGLEDLVLASPPLSPRPLSPVLSVASITRSAMSPKSPQEMAQGNLKNKRDKGIPKSPLSVRPLSPVLSVASITRSPKSPQEMAQEILKNKRNKGIPKMLSPMEMAEEILRSVEQRPPLLPTMSAYTAAKVEQVIKTMKKKKKKTMKKGGKPNLTVETIDIKRKKKLQKLLEKDGISIDKVESVLSDDDLRSFLSGEMPVSPGAKDGPKKATKKKKKKAGKKKGMASNSPKDSESLASAAVGAGKKSAEEQVEAPVKMSKEKEALEKAVAFMASGKKTKISKKVVSSSDISKISSSKTKKPTKQPKGLVVSTEEPLSPISALSPAPSTAKPPAAPAVSAPAPAHTSSTPADAEIIGSYLSSPKTGQDQMDKEPVMSCLSEPTSPTAVQPLAATTALSPVNFPITSPAAHARSRANAAIHSAMSALSPTAAQHHAPTETVPSSDEKLQKMIAAATAIAEISLANNPMSPMTSELNNDKDITTPPVVNETVKIEKSPSTRSDKENSSTEPCDLEAAKPATKVSLTVDTGPSANPEMPSSSNVLLPSKQSVEDVDALLSKTRTWLVKHNESQQKKARTPRPTPSNAKSTLPALSTSMSSERQVMGNITAKTVLNPENSSSNSIGSDALRLMSSARPMSPSLVEQLGLIKGVSTTPAVAGASLSSISSSASSGGGSGKKSILEQLSEIRAKQEEIESRQKAKVEQA